MRRIQHLLPLAFLWIPTPAAAAEMPVAQEASADASAAADAQGGAEASPADQCAHDAKPPRLTIWGDYRWLYGKARMELPSIHQRRDVFLSTRRFRVAPTLHLNDTWSVGAMLEDIRYDKDTIAGAHKNDHHLYLSRLFVEHENGYGQKIRAGRFVFTPIEGNVFDKCVESVRWRHGDKDVGMTSIFYGRTVAPTGDKRKRGVILGYERNWAKWMGGAFYYDLTTERPAVTAAALHNPLALRNGLDRQCILELFAGYRFDRYRSLEVEYLYGRARTNLDGWTERGSGCVATLRLRQSPNVEKAGDYGAWIAYYHQPRATHIHHAMDADPSFFGRAGFRGWGARADVVLARGLALPSRDSTCVPHTLRLPSCRRAAITVHVSVSSA